MKRRINVIVIVLAVLLLVFVFFILALFNQTHRTNEFFNFTEYKSYTTQNANYTISLRDSSELGLFGAIRLSIYLVNNENGHVKFISQKRLDYYDDFVPYVDFFEDNAKVTVVFYNKNSTSQIEIPIS